MTNAMVYQAMDAFSGQEFQGGYALQRELVPSRFNKIAILGTPAADEEAIVMSRVHLYYSTAGRESIRLRTEWTMNIKV